MTQFRFTSAALTELSEATLYYEQRENGLGTAFLDEIEATLERILQHPVAWHRYSKRRGQFVNVGRAEAPQVPRNYDRETLVTITVT